MEPRIYKNRLIASKKDYKNVEIVSRDGENKFVAVITRADVPVEGEEGNKVDASIFQTIENDLNAVSTKLDNHIACGVSERIPQNLEARLNELEQKFGNFAINSNTGVKVGGEFKAVVEFSENPQSQLDLANNKIATNEINMDLLSRSQTTVLSAVSAIQSDYLTKTTEQTITGKKEFVGNDTTFKKIIVKSVINKPPNIISSATWYGNWSTYIDASDGGLVFSYEQISKVELAGPPSSGGATIVKNN